MGALQKGSGSRGPCCQGSLGGTPSEARSPGLLETPLFLLQVLLPPGVSRTRIPRNRAGMEHRVASPTRTFGNDVML